MLSHANLAASVASLAPLFPLEARDRVLCLPDLAICFELTLGLLLPLSRGSRVVFAEGSDLDSAMVALSRAHVTVAIAQPAMWHQVGVLVKGRLRTRSAVSASLSKRGLKLNRSVGKRAGLDIGRFLFPGAHRYLGGHVRLLVSLGGAAEPETRKLFSGLGLTLSECFGVTEGSVLSAAPARAGGSHPGLGRAAPDVQLRVDAPDAAGVGEILARGPSVTSQYLGDDAAARSRVTPDGWLRTGRFGQLDGSGRLSLHDEAASPARAHGAAVPTEAGAKGAPRGRAAQPAPSRMRRMLALMTTRGRQAAE
jgi:long-chain acyl-CoA synthetase